jgi:phosphoribosylamine--glycine ligase
MKVLVIGSGGREHAICWKLSQSPLLEELFCAPGSPGIAQVADLVPIAVDEVQELADFATALKIDLTVVGPELPLTLGIVDEFRGRGLAVFGPRQAAAELEGSKVFAKQFMDRFDIPTAEFEIAHDADEARRFAERFDGRLVLKADGLAAGKGVILPANEEELERALAMFFEEHRFGASAKRIVVEERLEGEEVSLISLSDGKNLLPLATSKDYKRIGDDDTGPNTGGMGSHSPSYVISDAEADELSRKLGGATLQGMADENRGFQGILYVGVILTADGPKVLEYNVRLGDPEAQAILLRLEDDLLPILAAGAAGDFGVEQLTFSEGASVCLVLANEGYPGKPISGDTIEGLGAAQALEGVEVFHAGTKEQDGKIIAASGRVLNVCAAGADLRQALDRAYEATDLISWPRKTLRSDIGKRVLL